MSSLRGKLGRKNDFCPDLKPTLWWETRDEEPLNVAFEMLVADEDNIELFSGHNFEHV